jgi:hypothetical protein
VSGTSFWQTTSNLVFSLTIFSFAVCLLVLTIVAFFTSSLWAIGIALLFTIVGAHLCYRRARGKSFEKTLCCVNPPLLFIAMTVIIFYGKLWTPVHLLFLANIEFLVAVALIFSITHLLCERYFTLKLEE